MLPVEDVKLSSDLHERRGEEETSAATLSHLDGHHETAGDRQSLCIPVTTERHRGPTKNSGLAESEKLDSQTDEIYSW